MPTIAGPESRTPASSRRRPTRAPQRRRRCESSNDCQTTGSATAKPPEGSPRTSVKVLAPRARATIRVRPRTFGIPAHRRDGARVRSHRDTEPSSRPEGGNGQPTAPYRCFGGGPPAPAPARVRVPRRPGLDEALDVAGAWPQTGWRRRSATARRRRRVRARSPTPISPPSSGCRGSLRLLGVAEAVRDRLRRRAAGRARGCGGELERRLHLDALAPETPSRRGGCSRALPRAGALGSPRCPDAGGAASTTPTRAARAACRCGWSRASGPTAAATAGRSPAAGFLRVVDGCAATGRGRGRHARRRLLAESLRRLSARHAVRGRALLRPAVPGPGAAARRVGGSAPHLRPVWPRRRALRLSRTSCSNPAAAWWLVQDLVLGKDKTWRSIRRRGRSCDARRADAADTIPWVNSVFEQPWWLDAVAPGRWSAAEVRRGDEVVARLPYMRRRRYGLDARSSSRPLTQTLGPWLAPARCKYPRRLEAEKRLSAR